MTKTRQKITLLWDSWIVVSQAIGSKCRHPDEDEDTLSRYQSRLVSRPTLARAIECLDLLPYSRRCGGTDHAPEFHCQVQVAQHSAEGTGGSRRAAEVAAANALLASLDETPIIDPS